MPKYLTEIEVGKDEENIIKLLAIKIEIISNEAIKKHGKFRVGFSGGSLIKYLCQSLPTIKSDWSKWEIFFCDERYVPENDEDSTYGVYKKQLIPITELNEKQFHTIKIDLPLNECARDYEEQIMKVFNLNQGEIPEFDLLLLGMGPDGHTCSLFPNHKLLDETDRLIAPINDSPKPPLERVTMTYPLINNSTYCIFPIFGKAKKPIVEEILVERKRRLPAGRVEAKNKIIWILDSEYGIKSGQST